MNDSPQPDAKPPLCFVTFRATPAPMNPDEKSADFDKTHFDENTQTDNPLVKVSQWFRFNGAELHTIFIKSIKGAETRTATVQRIILTHFLDGNGKITANRPKHKKGTEKIPTDKIIAEWHPSPESALLENNPDLKAAIDCWNKGAKLAQKLGLDPAAIKTLATTAITEEFKRVTCGTKTPSQILAMLPQPPKKLKAE